MESAEKGLAQVYIPGGSAHIIDLKEKSCSCGEFQEYLIPCRHAVAVCLWQTEDPYKYVDEWYSIEYYRRTYAQHMHPIREEDLVDDYSDCEAPELTQQKGRPKKRRMRRGKKKSKRNVCGHCGQKGHNRRSCRNAVA